MHKSNTGFTFIELLVVMVVMTVLAMIGFYGLASYRRSDTVTAAQKDFLATLRSVQNQVENGAHGASIMYVKVLGSGAGYSVNYKDALGVTQVQSSVSLPLGMITTPGVSGDFDICFVNKNVTSFDNMITGRTCNGCTAGANGFVCQGSTLTTGSVTVTFSQTKSVGIEGTGLHINRIYEQ